MASFCASRFLQIAGILAWTACAAAIWSDVGDRPSSVSAPIALGLAVFLGSFLLATRERDAVRVEDRRLRLAGLAFQFLSAFALSWMARSDVPSVLFTVALSQLPWQFSLRACMTAIAVFFTGHAAFMSTFASLELALVSSMLYASFALFAVFTVLQTVREQRQREELARLHGELKATQHLLSAAARETERVAISRDLHDRMGHHLTALTIQLDIASRLCEGEAKLQIERSRHLAKLLLADVRDVVGNLRERKSIDLPAALRALIADLPRLDVELSIPDDFQVGDALRAQVLLRAAQEIITNCLRHAGASRLSLVFERRGSELLLRARDDGRGCATVRAGNGLRGLRERVQALHGSFAADSGIGQGFSLTISIPESAL